MRKMCRHGWALLHWYQGHTAQISAILPLKDETKKTGERLVICLYIGYYEIFFLILNMRNTTSFSTSLIRSFFQTHFQLEFFWEPLC